MKGQRAWLGRSWKAPHRYRPRRHTREFPPSQIRQGHRTGAARRPPWTAKISASVGWIHSRFRYLTCRVCFHSLFPRDPREGSVPGAVANATQGLALSVGTAVHVPTHSANKTGRSRGSAICVSRPVLLSNSICEHETSKLTTMGNRQSAASESAGASAPAPGGFGVRVRRSRRVPATPISATPSHLPNARTQRL